MKLQKIAVKNLKRRPRLQALVTCSENYKMAFLLNFGIALYIVLMLQLSYCKVQAYH